jgi:multiple sugar transport system ATP-binding protein
MSMRSELAKLHERLGATMIYVTHDQDEAMMLGDRLVVVKDGRVQQTGTPLNVYERPVNRFVAQFIGSPPMNVLAGRLRETDGGLHIDFDAFSLELPADRRESCQSHLGKSVLFGVRPEHIIGDAPGQRAGAWRSVTATTVISQPLGADTIVELRCGQDAFRARMDAQIPLRQRQDAAVWFDTSKCLLFDPADEQVISGP